MRTHLTAVEPGQPADTWLTAKFTCAPLNGFLCAIDAGSTAKLKVNQMSMTLVQILHLQWMELDCLFSERNFLFKATTKCYSRRWLKLGLRIQCILSRSCWPHEEFAMGVSSLRSSVSSSPIEQQNLRRTASMHQTLRLLWPVGHYV